MAAKSCLIESGGTLRPHPSETSLGCPRDFLDNRFVYLVVSARARGLSICINMNPDKLCNFDCIYCEVDRAAPPAEKELDIFVMAEELQRTLTLVASGKIRELPAYRGLSDDLAHLRHVAFSGDGEPTLSPQYAEAVQEVVHVRARHSPFFKLVLITNGTALDSPAVQESLHYFTREDEIWIKLDAGTQAHMDVVNRGQVPLQKVLDNALLIGRRHPIVIQSLFPQISGLEPSLEEIDAYVHCLNELKHAGAQISSIQIYSATRPSARPDCEHLPLKILSRISQQVKAQTGLKAEVF
jgi:wyosine [tRNA(Phe)-imidazoG37] synthetase (radical SAM superfamily)